jgi:hypothetical protein
LVTDNQPVQPPPDGRFVSDKPPPDGRFATDKLAATVTGISPAQPNPSVTVSVDAWRLQFGRHSRLPDWERPPGANNTFPEIVRFWDHVKAERRLPDVGCYGGAHDRMTSAPYISIFLERGWRGPVHFGGGGDFVVWEIEVKDQRVARLAIDFIGPRASGSLRINSCFQPVEPELDR